MVTNSSIFKDNLKVITNVLSSIKSRPNLERRNKRGKHTGNSSKNKTAYRSARQQHYK